MKRKAGMIALLALLVLLPGCSFKVQFQKTGAERVHFSGDSLDHYMGAIPGFEEKQSIRLIRSYDYREKGRVSAVKNQGTLGTCWAFASLMALETSLLPEETYDFSEDHMSLNRNFRLDQDEGGEYTMSMAYLLSWQGPVREEDDPYGDEISPDGLEAVKHVQEIQILPSKDYGAIKEAIYKYGGVQSSLYTSLKNDESRSQYYNRENKSYYYDGEEPPNHDIVVVGWNDDYPREMFNKEPAGDGAFICANSWGEEFGEDGFFYVSYFDARIGIHNIVYTGIEPTDNYDHIYQTDLCGWIGQLGYGKETAYFANVYQTDKREVLKAIGFYATGQNTEYEAYLIRNVGQEIDFSHDKRERIASGTLVREGYYTIPASQEHLLEVGERFAIMVKIRTPESIHPVAIEYDAEDGKCRVDLTDGEGYISLNGDRWERVETEQGCNLCLKAYTVDPP